MYIYTIMSRKKDNQEIQKTQKKKGFTYTHLSNHMYPSFYDMQILKTKARQTEGFDKLKWRVYRTVDRRSEPKAINLMMHHMIDNPSFDKNFISKYIKFLGKEECRETNHWLLDIDTKDTVVLDKLFEMLDYSKIEIIQPIINTPNGHHLITKGFNPILLEPFKDIEHKTNVLLYITSINIPTLGIG